MAAEEKVNAQKPVSRLTPIMAWNLAAPHTWPASIMPVLLAVCAAYANTGMVSVTMSCTLLLICVLMQSSVNTFNDYFDYVKGSDTEDDNVDSTDSVLVYNDVNPHSVLALAIAFLVAAFLLGIYPIVVAGWIPLAIGVAGAFIVFLYSGGPAPLSYLPLGELVSGFVMGGLITLACYQVLTLDLNWLALVWSIPLILGIALIMFTNNTCDIEKDVLAKRRTLPVMLDRKRSKAIYRALMIVWITAIACIVCIWFTGGTIIVPFMVLASYPLLRALWNNPLEPQSRIAAMAQICSVNIALGAFYALAVAMNGAVLLF